VMGWTLDHDALLEVDRIVREAVADPVGPEFMAPPSRSTATNQDKSPVWLAVTRPVFSEN
jgi:hypothetical protein